MRDQASSKHGRTELNPIEITKTKRTRFRLRTLWAQTISNVDPITLTGIFFITI